MKRRFFALLAVSALALGFALASPGPEQAHAYGPWISQATVCALYDWKIGESVMQGDELTARQRYDQAEQAGCE
jgi:hypothetical protein